MFQMEAAQVKKEIWRLGNSACLCRLQETPQCVGVVSVLGQQETPPHAQLWSAFVAPRRCRGPTAMYFKTGLARVGHLQCRDLYWDEVDEVLR